MNAESPSADVTADAAGIRSRDADGTRQRLLEAARLRFARDGYTTTTVRDIAADAGVNVALINRYFSSKEGLFEACVTQTGQQLTRPSTKDVTVEGIVRTIIDYIAGSPTGEQPVQLLLLLQSSGDDRADALRRDILQAFALRLAAASSSQPEGAYAEEVVLRAQVALSALLGVVLVRATTGLHPLSAVPVEDLAGPLTELLTDLLARR